LDRAFTLFSLTGPGEFVMDQSIPVSLKRGKELSNQANQDRLMKGGDASPAGVSQKLTFNF
jgi:hypothetical protein